MVYDSIYVKFKNRQNLYVAIEIVTIVTYRGLKGNIGEFQGEMRMFYILFWVLVTQMCMFFKTH